MLLKLKGHKRVQHLIDRRNFSRTKLNDESTPSIVTQEHRFSFSATLCPRTSVFKCCDEIILNSRWNQSENPIQLSYLVDNWLNNTT